MENKNKKLLLTAILLALTFIFSFFPQLFNGDNKSIIKSALFNKNNSEKVTAIELADSETSITLSKKGHFWTIFQSDFPENQLPADSKKIETLLNNLTNIRNMYKFSDKITKNSDFGLSGNGSFRISLFYDGKTTDIFFGKMNFAETNQFVKSGASDTIYQIDDSLKNFQTTSTQVWADPFLISREVFGLPDIQSSNCTDIPKLLELRHGGFANQALPDGQPAASPIKYLLLHTGNKEQISLTIYEAADNSDYKVKTKYESENQKEEWEFYSKISAWTYNKISEITL